jgi:hypothetical protein
MGEITIDNAIDEIKIEETTKKSRFQKKEPVEKEANDLDSAMKEVKMVKVKFKRDLNFYYGEKKYKYSFNEVKSIPILVYNILKANPNNLELVI